MTTRVRLVLWPAPRPPAYMLMRECARFRVCGGRSALQTMTRPGMIGMMMMHEHARAQARNARCMA